MGAEAMTHAAILGGLACLALTAASAGGEADVIPPRPTYPIRMDGLSDAEFGRLFFAEIDLDHPGLEATKVAVERGDFTAALAAWSQAFTTRLGALPLVPWPAQNWYPVDLLMHADRVVLRHNSHDKDFGPPGRMSWYDLEHWKSHTGEGLHVNFMWHTKSLIATVEANLGKATPRAPARNPHANDALYARWVAIWRDFVNNNWRIGMPLAAEPALRRERLAAAGLDAEPSEWGSSVAFRQQLVVSWLLGNWFADTQHAIHASPKEFVRHVPPRVVAEMVYFMVVWPVENLADMRRATPEKLAGGCPNQSQEKAVQLLRVGAAVPEFHRGRGLLDLAGRLIETILGTPGHRAATTDCQADGSGTELSYNYMPALVNAAEKWCAVGETLTPRPAWIEPAREAAMLRRRFLANLVTPSGMQPLCKGAHGGKPSVPLVGRDGTVPAYTSIMFPFHGLSMTRSGWGERDLFLSLVNCRVGQGHAAEDANSIMVEAHGRLLLVHNAGEGFGDSPYFGSSWAKNTVHVDGLAQLRCARAPHGAYAEPQDGRWHTSPRFDVAEATYRYGYGTPPTNARERPQPTVTDVTHTRQVVFVKDAALWFVIDIVVGPPEAEHDYAQLWHFHHSFPNDAVVVDDARRTIATADPGGPNVFLCQASTAPLAYRRFHAAGRDGTGPWSTHTVPVTARGWHNVGGGYDSAAIHPAVDVHATWRGCGRQVVVTAIVPAATAENPSEAHEPIAEEDGVGLALRMRDGRRVRCLVARGPAAIRLPAHPAPAHGIVVVERDGEPIRGVALGPDPELRRTVAGLPGADCEFSVEDGTVTTTAAIRVPTGFRWREGPAGLEPEYE